jgi:hypothetical protein
MGSGNGVRVVIVMVGGSVIIIIIIHPTKYQHYHCFMNHHSPYQTV